MVRDIVGVYDPTAPHGSPRDAFEDGVVDCDSMVRADARRITQGFIHVRSARMCNTLCPVEVEYLSITGVHMLHISYGRWRVSSSIDLVVT
jgi:hypothetical protein